MDDLTTPLTPADCALLLIWPAGAKDRFRTHCGLSRM